MRFAAHLNDASMRNTLTAFLIPRFFVGTVAYKSSLGAKLATVRASLDVDVDLKVEQRS